MTTDRWGTTLAAGADARTESDVPPAVSDDEKYIYLDAQQRWYLVFRFLAFTTLLISFSRFAYTAPRLGGMFVVVVAFFAISAISLFTSTRRSTVTRASHTSVVRRWRSDQAATVDILLPSCGEDLDVLANTFHAVAALDYPRRLVVYVLDDSGREDVRRLARRCHFRYLSRPDRGRMKKAGNLAYGYERSRSRLIAVFDADFAPRRDFLLELVPYFDNSDVAIVQSPQYFDTRTARSWLRRAAGATQELFYRWVQPARDAMGAPICVGTCALYRRAALRQAGGFAQVPHSEDVHTGVRVMRAGYCVRYVPVVLARGVCPSALDAFVTQQYRWCAGSMSLLLDREFRSMPLSWRQRLCFWSGFGYYISTAVAAFTALVPPTFLLWLAPHSIHARYYLLLVPVILVYPLNVLVHRGAWSLSVLRVQLVYSFAHAVAVWDSWRGETAEWVATGVAARTPLSRRIRRLMVGWLLVTQTLLWVGIARDLGGGVVSLGNMYPLLLFATFAVYLQAPLIGASIADALRVPRRHLLEQPVAT